MNHCQWIGLGNLKGLDLKTVLGSIYRRRWKNRWIGCRRYCQILYPKSKHVTFFLLPAGMCCTSRHDHFRLLTPSLFLYIAHGPPSAENAYHELRGLFAYAVTPKSMAEKVQHFNSDHYSCFFSHRTPGLTSSSSRPRPPRAAGPGCYTASSPSSQLRDIVASFSSYD